jgi:hypothetical protein
LARNAGGQRQDSEARAFQLRARRPIHHDVDAGQLAVAGAAYLGLAGNRKVALASDDSRKAALEPVTDGTGRSRSQQGQKERRQHRDTDDDRREGDLLGKR